jgi:hypothetical protein
MTAELDELVDFAVDHVSKEQIGSSSDLKEFAVIVNATGERQIINPYEDNFERPLKLIAPAKEMRETGAIAWLCVMELANKMRIIAGDGDRIHGGDWRIRRDHNGVVIALEEVVRHRFDFAKDQVQPETRMPDNDAFADLVPAEWCDGDDTLRQGAAGALHQSAELIRRFEEQQTEARLAIGRELIAVGQLLPPDKFDAWIRGKLEMTDETACAYLVAANEKITADPADCNKSLSAKLIGWQPDRDKAERYGYADIALPSGVTLRRCPVYSAGPDGPQVKLSCASHIFWLGGLYSDKFNQGIIEQIREVHPGAFEQEPSPLSLTDRPGWVANREKN